MSRYHSYLKAACAIIESADHGKPLSFSLKQYFGSHPQMGSRDRKYVSTLCYNYFRTFYAFRERILAEAVIHADFICSTSVNEFLAFHAPNLNPFVTLSLEEKFTLLNLKLEKLFPFTQYVSNKIAYFPFLKSLMVQPDSFLRARRGRHKEIAGLLEAAGILFAEPYEGVIRFPGGQAVDKIVNLDRDAVIQDYSSQQVFSWVANHLEVLPNKTLDVWDCCAASGGKSILLFDILKTKPKITVSDIRKQSIHNLKTRLGKAGVPLHRAVVGDLSQDGDILPGEKFDLIIADVPCSGSGTWARTPEQMAWFRSENLSSFQATQKAISQNAARHLTAGGLFFYITCSVFADENESMVEWLCKNGLVLIDASYICGYNGKADTMFSAVLKKVN